MKRLLILLLAFSLVFTFAACHSGTGIDNDSAADGNGAPANDEDSEVGPNGFGNLISGEYAALMQSGRYYIEFITYGMGVEVQTSIAVDGADSDTQAKVQDQVSRALILDDIIYNLNESSKTYTITPYNPETQGALKINADYSNLTYTGKGNGPIPGFTDIDNASYNYDEYTVQTDNETSGMTLRYYMNNETLYAIYMNVMGDTSVMRITTISDEIPEGLLELPDGYTQVFTYF